MPWLVREEEKASPKDALLFVHVPRCGGTSLSKLFKIEKRYPDSVYNMLGLMYFFYRYRLLETTNYPWRTVENCLALIMASVAMIVFFAVDDTIAPYIMWSSASLMLLSSTFIFVAPVVGRNTFARRAYALVVGKVLCAPLANVKWLTGCNDKGWLMHLTAENMVRYDYVDRETFERVSSFAIVRNPYSRMVSVWMYNRMGPLEDFATFVRRWMRKVAHQQQRGGMCNEWDVYCHVPPQHCFTHSDNKQLVQCIIRQEDLKSMKSPAPAPGFDLLPEPVHQALLDMPHTNKRAKTKPWQEYYTKETMQQVLEMYGRDFAQFGYATAIPGRPELGCPSLTEEVWSNMHVAHHNRALPAIHRESPQNAMNMLPTTQIDSNTATATEADATGSISSAGTIRLPRPGPPLPYPAASFPSIAATAGASPRG